MEKKLPYGLILSLREISLRQVTIILWSQTAILDSCDRYTLEMLKVKHNIRKLELPSLLIEQIKFLVKPIGSEITQFKMFHEEHLAIRFDKHISEQICWTHLETIDFRKTAENIIRFKMLDVIQLYKLACLYCLDDYIPVLWEKLPELRKIYFCKRMQHFVQTPLLFSWPYILKGEESKVNYMSRGPIRNTLTFNLNTFEYSARKGNKAAAEYFFRKLTDDERKSSLIRTTQAAISQRLEGFHYENFPERKICETICYLLSLMSSKQQMEIFKEDPCKVLICFLDWPWQELFLEIADRLWSFFSAADYVCLLRKISMKMKIVRILTKLFQEFFLRGSSDFRRHFVDEECQRSFFLEACFDIHDSETIKLIFRNVNSVDRKRLVSSEFALAFFYGGFFRGTWCLVELCLKEAALSAADKAELKVAFNRTLIEQISTKYCDVRQNIWEQFCHFLDEADSKAPSQINSDEADSKAPSQISSDEENLPKDENCTEEKILPPLLQTVNFADKNLGDA